MCSSPFFTTENDVAVQSFIRKEAQYSDAIYYQISSETNTTWSFISLGLQNYSYMY